MGAFYCAVCRQTFFSGKKHIFGKSHQSRLRVVILKFIEKVRTIFTIVAAATATRRGGFPLFTF